jgi:hypothetical protein
MTKIKYKNIIGGLMKFDTFVNEGILTVEDSMDDFETTDGSKWVLEFNVSGIWNQYMKDKNYTGFIKKYKETLLEKREELLKIGKPCWNDLVKIVKERPKIDDLPYLDKIYDWADDYGIKITTKNNVQKT